MFSDTESNRGRVGGAAFSERSASELGCVRECLLMPPPGKVPLQSVWFYSCFFFIQVLFPNLYTLIYSNHDTGLQSCSAASNPWKVIFSLSFSPQWDSPQPKPSEAMLTLWPLQCKYYSIFCEVVNFKTVVWNWSWHDTNIIWKCFVEFASLW